MTEEYRGPRSVPDRIIGPNENLLVWVAAMLALSGIAWLIVLAAWWAIR